MESRKKYVFLPLGLLGVELLKRSTIGGNPWYYLTAVQLNFWQRTGYFLLRLFGHAAYIVLLALLFLYVFTNRKPADLFKKTALKAMGIVFAVDLIIQLLLNSILWPWASRALFNRGFYKTFVSIPYGKECYAIIVGLLSSIPHFLIVYLTLRLLLKPLHLGFSFHKSWFSFIVLFYVAVKAFESYGLLRLTDYISAPDNAALDMVRIFGRTIGVNEFNVILAVIGGLIFMFLNWIIFDFINRCTYPQDSVPKD